MPSCAQCVCVCVCVLLKADHRLMLSHHSLCFFRLDANQFRIDTVPFLRLLSLDSAAFACFRSAPAGVF